MTSGVDRVRLKSISIRNFRSCTRTLFTPHEDLSCLIGPNGSGKTAILSAIRLLRSLISLYEYDRLSEAPSGVCRLVAKFALAGRTISLRCDLAFAPDDRDGDKLVDARAEWNLEEVGGPAKWVQLPLARALHRSLFDGGISTPEGRWEKMVEGRIKDVLRWSSGVKLSLRAIRAVVKVADFLNGISYYGASQFTNPLKYPASFELEEQGRLSFRSRSSAKFLSDLYRSYSDRKSTDYEQFRSLVGGEGLGLIKDITFKQYDLPESQVKVSVGGNITRKTNRRRLVVPGFMLGKKRLSPSQLSEGTFKTLALIFYLVSDHSRLLLLEEPEVCVHHGLLTSIVQLIKTYAHEKQIVFSTHSDFVLDALPPEKVFIVSMDAKLGTLVRAVPKVLSANDFRALKRYLAETGNLGEFWRHGGFATIN